MVFGIGLFAPVAMVLQFEIYLILLGTFVVDSLSIKRLSYRLGTTNPQAENSGWTVSE